MATSDFGPTHPCGKDYVMTVDGLNCEAIAMESATWGDIKNEYR